MERDKDDLSPIKRYKSDPTLFMDLNASCNNGNESLLSDHSENATSSKSIRRQLVARRLSTSNLSPRTIMRIPSRLDQIKFEESVDKCTIEAAHEKEVQCALSMSRSWEHLCLSDCEPMMVDGQKAPYSCDHINLLRQMSSTSSPARPCISPLAIFSSTSSPSYQSSRASPVIMKHSPLNVAKRKLNVGEGIFSPAKKFLLSNGTALNIMSTNAKPTNYSEETMSSCEEPPAHSSRIASQDSLSSSPLICHSDDSSSPSISGSQPLSFQVNLSLSGEDVLPRTGFFQPLRDN